MSLEQAILEKVRDLPAEQQQKVLDFADSLRASAEERPPLRSPEGLWDGLGVSISEEDIVELRREMWKNFPREDI